jgi:hypothetical protein
MASFEITSARQFLAKLHEEQSDFAASHFQSSRHALNAVITAYHLHEWVWGALRARPDHQQIWPYKSHKQFLNKFLVPRCPQLASALSVADGTKHFQLGKIPAGKHRGVFQSGVFQPSVFDVSYLWIKHNGHREPADAFIAALVNFWDGFLDEHQL